MAVFVEKIWTPLKLNVMFFKMKVLIYNLLHIEVLRYQRASVLVIKQLSPLQPTDVWTMGSRVGLTYK